MFDWFKSKKSPLRQALEGSLSVGRTWFEWTLDGDVLAATLVVSYHYELDPTHPNFQRDGLDELRRIVQAAAPPVPRIRIVPFRASD